MRLIKKLVFTSFIGLVIHLTPVQSNDGATVENKDLKTDINGNGNTVINGVIINNSPEPPKDKPKIPSYRYKITNSQELLAFAEEFPTWEIFKDSGAEIIYLDISLPKQGYDISVMPEELDKAIFTAMEKGWVEFEMSPLGFAYESTSKNGDENAYFSFIDTSKGSVDGKDAVSECLNRFSNPNSSYLKNTSSQFGVCNTNTWIYFEGKEDDIQMFAVNMSEDPIGLRIKGYYKLKSYRNFSAFGNREYILESVSRSEAWAELGLQ